MNFTVTVYTKGTSYKDADKIINEKSFMERGEAERFAKNNNTSSTYSYFRNW